MMSKEQSDDINADIKLLLECLEYQKSNPGALKQAMVTLSSAVCGSGSQKEQDMFRNAGGIQKILKIVTTSKSDEVIEVGLFCIGNAVEKNVYSQKLLSTASFFNFLHGILSPSGNAGVKKRQMAAFVLLCLVSNNSFGQNMARQSSCLHDILSLIRTNLSTSTDRHGNRSLETWATLVRAACVCVNNPINDENQRICSTLFPYLLNVVGTHTDEGILKPALSLICLTVSYNAQNQGKLARCGGLPILIKKLKSLVIETQDTANHQVAIQVIRTLDVCLTENEVNSKTFGEMGGVILVLNMLLSPGLKSQDKIQLVLTLAHAVEAYDTNKDSISMGNGIKTLIQLMTGTGDDELTKTTKYLLHLCVSSDKKEAVTNEEMPTLDVFASKLEEMKRNSDMEILKKLNDLDTKLKDIENRETDSNKNIGLSGICEQKPETVWSDMIEKPSQHRVNRAVSVCSSNSVSCQHSYPTPREKTLMDELIKEKIEREKVEKLNQLLQEDIEMRRATEKERQSNEIKQSHKLAHKNTSYLVQSDEVVHQFKQTDPCQKVNDSREDWNIGTLLDSDWSDLNSHLPVDKTEVPVYVNRNTRYIAPCKPNSNTLYVYPIHGATTLHEDGAMLNVDDNHFGTIHMNNNRNMNVSDELVADISRQTLHQFSESKATNKDHGNKHNMVDNRNKFVQCSQQTLSRTQASSTFNNINTVSNQERLSEGPKRSFADAAEDLDYNNNSIGRSKNAEIPCGTPYVNNGGKKDATSMTEVDGSSQTHFANRSNDNKRKLIDTSTEACPSSVKQSVMNNKMTNKLVQNKVAKVVLSDVMSPTIVTKFRQENISNSQPKQLSSADIRPNESQENTNMFVKPTSAPPKKKVRVTPLLGTRTQLNNLKNCDRKKVTVYAESSFSGVESEFDRQLIKAIKNVNKKIDNDKVNANHSLKYGGGVNKIKSQNNTSKLDKYLDNTRHDATYMWRMASTTPQSQQLIPVRPAFSDCGTRRLNVLDSPYSVKSVGCLGKNNLHENGMDMQEEIRQTSPGNSSVDSNIEDCRSSSDVSESDARSLNITAAALRSHRKQHRVSNMCPGCHFTSDDKGNCLTSRNYNLVLETHPNTCMYHRQLRAFERRYIKTTKKHLQRGKKHSGRLLDFKKVAGDKKTTKCNDYVMSDSDSDHVSPPDQDEDWDGKMYRKQRTRKERRHRVPYTREEEDNLIEGVRKMGKHWNQILVTYSFHPSRTNVDLMDKYKRMVAADNSLSEMHSTKQSRVSKPFSLCEERRLRKGVKLYGHNWKAILQAYGFDKDRTSEELRNKWRVLQKQLGLE